MQTFHLCALLIAACATPTAAFRVNAASLVAPRNAPAISTRAVALSATPAEPRTTKAPVMMAKEASPLQIGFIALGALGVVFAAYCTSTGSPPTGLAVAVFSCVFMAGGAEIIEEGGLPKRE